MKENGLKMIREARNAYARKWRAANPDKVKAANARYWLRKAAKDAKNADASQNGKDVDNG